MDVINDLIGNAEKYNREWLHNHKDHYLYHTFCILHAQNDTFAITSCEVTAETIKSKLGYSRSKLLEETNVDTISDYSFLQITFGEDWSDVQHTLLIYDNHILQSYYGKYKLKATKIDRNVQELLRDPIKNYFEITGVNITYLDYLRVFYWIPY